MRLFWIKWACFGVSVCFGFAFLVLLASLLFKAPTPQVKEYLIYSLDDSGPGTVRRALESDHPGPIRIRSIVGGKVELKTDIVIDRDFPIDFDGDFSSPLVLTARGVIISRLESSSIKNLCIYSGSSTVLKKITGEWEDGPAENIYSRELPDNLKAIYRNWSDLETAVYSPDGLPDTNQELKQLPKLSRYQHFAEFLEDKTDQSFHYHSTEGRIYLCAENYSPDGEAYFATKKNKLPDPLTLKSGVVNVLFENDSFGSGNDIAVSMDGVQDVVFRKCLFNTCNAIVMHPKRVDHSKGIWCNQSGLVTFDQCVTVNIADRAPMANQGGSMIVVNCSTQKGGNIFADNRRVDLHGGMKVDFYNNLVKSPAILKLLISDDPANKVHIGKTEFNDTIHENPWTIADTKNGPFVARTTLNSADAVLVPESVRSAAPIHPAVETIPLGELRQHLKANCGAYPTNRYQLCQQAIDNMEGEPVIPNERDEFPEPEIQSSKDSFKALAEKVETLLNRE